MKRICVDAGFLIALYDETDEHHTKASAYFTTYFGTPPNQLLVPWPILYETISTRMTRNRRRMESFQRDWKALEKQRRLLLLDDQDFRQHAVDECLAETEKTREHYRPLSLADRVIRKMLSEVNIEIDVFITFNQGDFADVCKRFRRQLV